MYVLLTIAWKLPWDVWPLLQLQGANRWSRKEQKVAARRGNVWIVCERAWSTLWIISKYITLAAWALYIYYTLLLVGFQALGNTGGTGRKKGASLISSCLFAQVLGIKVQHNAGNVTGKLRVTFPISWNQEFLPRAPHVIFIQQRLQRVPSTSLWRPCLPPDRCSFFFFFSGFDEAKSIAALRMLKQSFPFFFFLFMQH